MISLWAGADLWSNPEAGDRMQMGFLGTQLQWVQASREGSDGQVQNILPVALLTG